MRRAFTSLAIAAGLLVGAGAAVASPAAAAPAYDSNSYWYTGTYYSGAQYYASANSYETVWLPAIHSVINHTNTNFCGFNGNGNTYTFWHSSSGGWPTIGAPFTSVWPLAGTHIC
ncbi:hypothetical protein ACIF70_39620 [Actinacidiphila glaucinigra]|uniref:hypothetical protein n=1 Tax=Actinacidiphila glaucinigra TaxID=235986 RepID=UPI0037C8ADC8